MKLFDGGLDHSIGQAKVPRLRKMIEEIMTERSAPEGA